MVPYALIVANLSKCIIVMSGTTNPGGNRKPDNPLEGIRTPIPQKPDNRLRLIWDMVPKGIRSQWLRGLTVPT